MPLTALWYTKPADGIPLYPTWRNLASDIFGAGYEPLREPMEVRIRLSTSEFGSLQCTKGLGRLSVILYGALWTFLHKDSLSEDVQKDFARPNRKFMSA